MNWLTDYSPLISNFINFGMLAVWSVYAALLFRQYSRQHAPHVLVQATAGDVDRSQCLVANMSAEAVHVRGVIVSRDTVGTFHYLTEAIEDATPSLRTESALRQGPLRPGDFLTIGDGRSLLESACGGDPSPEEGEVSFEVRVVYQKLPGKIFGARRAFTAEPVDGTWRIVAQNLFTDQLTSRSQQKEVMDWLENA